MDEIQIPNDIVQKLNGMPGGIVQYLHQKAMEHGLVDRYDHPKGIYYLKGANEDILRLAVRTLKFEVEGFPEDVIKCLEGKKVVWKYCGDNSDRMSFFHPEIREGALKGGHSCQIDTKFWPGSYQVSWPYDSHDQCVKIMEHFESKLKTLHKDEVSVNMVDTQKVNDFVKVRGPESLNEVKFVFYDSERKCKIVGKSKKLVKKAKDEFFEILQNRPAMQSDFGSKRSSEPRVTIEEQRQPENLGGSLGNRNFPQSPRIDPIDAPVNNGSAKFGKAGQTTGLTAGGTRTTGGTNGAIRGTVGTAGGTRAFGGTGGTTGGTGGATGGTGGTTRETCKTTEWTRATGGRCGNTVGRCGTTEGTGGTIKGTGGTTGGRGGTSEERGGTTGVTGGTGVTGSNSIRGAKTFDATCSVKRQNKKHYEFSNKSGLTVLVYKESVTKVDGMDAVVNAANSHLQHTSGVASDIENAAGKSFTKECLEFIRANGHLEVTENCVTGAGKLNCRKVIHAVGPEWRKYTSAEDQCARAVYTTIINILKAAYEHHFVRIAIPAISSGIFGVPKQLCAQMYVKAFLEFKPPERVKGQSCPLEVHLVDIDSDILQQVEVAHKAWMKDKKCLEFDNAFKFVGQPVTMVTGNDWRRSDQGPEYFRGHPESVGNEEAYTLLFNEKDSKRGERWTYNIGTVTLEIYTGDLTQLKNVSAIVCPVNSSFIGGQLASSILQVSGKQYSKQLNDIGERNRSPKDGDVFFCQPGGQLKDQVVFLVCLSCIITKANKSELDKIRRVVSNVLKEANSSGMQSLAIPLIGAALLYTEQEKAKIIDTTIHAIVDFIQLSTSKLHLSKIHLVNLDRHASRQIQACVRKISGTSYLIQGSNSRPSNGTSRNTQTEFARSFSSNAGARHKDQFTSLMGAISVYEPRNDRFSNSSLEVAASSTTPDLENCSICMDTMTDPKILKCGHQFCRCCINEAFKHKPSCPICGTVHGVITGTQPQGTMHDTQTKDTKLPGYEKCGTIVISYNLPDGIQGPKHPRPGARYKGTRRKCYLPDNKKGRKVLRLLKEAWEKKLVFTVGDSRTRGIQDIVTWNDIHHKTSIDGGPQKFGYPDPTYLDRVLEELAAKGIK